MIEEAAILLDKIEPLINDLTIKNQTREWLNNYVEKENSTEILNSYPVVTPPPYSSQIWFKETEEHYKIVIYQTGIEGNYSSEIKFDKNKVGYLRNFIREIENRIDQ